METEMMMSDDYQTLKSFEIITAIAYIYQQTGHEKYGN